MQAWVIIIFSLLVVTVERSHSVILGSFDFNYYIMLYKNTKFKQTHS